MLHSGVSTNLPSSGQGCGSVSYGAVPHRPHYTCTAGPGIRSSGGSHQSREMPGAAPGDTCPQPTDACADQRSWSSRGRQQQQRPEHQQKSPELVRRGWNQHNGFGDLLRFLSLEVVGALRVRYGQEATHWQLI